MYIYCRVLICVCSNHIAFYLKFNLFLTQPLKTASYTVDTQFIAMRTLSWGLETNDLVLAKSCFGEKEYNLLVLTVVNK